MTKSKQPLTSIDELEREAEKLAASLFDDQPDPRDDRKRRDPSEFDEALANLSQRLKCPEER